MQAQVCVCVIFRERSDFGQPGTRHHDASGSNLIVVEGVKAGEINGWGKGKISGVDKKEFRIGGVARACGYSLILWARTRRGEKQEQAGGGKFWKAHKNLQ